MLDSDHDPGDEDRSERHGLCPFCGCEISGRRAWVTPMMDRHDDWRFEDAVADVGALRVDQLVTCNSEDCKRQARAMQRMSTMSTSKKQRLLDRFAHAIRCGLSPREARRHVYGDEDRT